MTPLQLESLRTTSIALFETSQGLFWTYLPLAFLLAIAVIYFSGDISGQSFVRLFKRVIIAAILLYAFPKISGFFVGIEDSLVKAFGGEESLHSIFAKISSHAKEIKEAGTSSWFKFGQWGLTLIATVSFLILSIVHHFLDVLHLTVWNLLHILGPLALLSILFPTFSKIASGVFFGMFELSLWRPVWVIIGRILVAIGFGDSPADPSQWFDAAIMNFAVAALMASTPMIVHSFLSGSLGSIGGTTFQTMIGGMSSFLARLPAKGIKTAKDAAVATAKYAGSTLMPASAAATARPHVNKSKDLQTKSTPSK